MLISLNQLLNNNINEITLLFGEEDYFLDDALQTIINHLVPDRKNNFNFELFNAGETNLDDILSLANSFPMMADQRVIAIKNFEKYFTSTSIKADNFPNLKQYIENPSPTTKLIIHSADKKLFKTSAAIKKLRTPEEKHKKLKAKKFPYGPILANHNSVEFEKVYPNKYPEWIKSKLKEKNKTISQDAINQIISISPESLRHLNNELEKLDLFTIGKNNITIDDVNQITGQNKDFNIFELQKSIAKKDLNKSLFILENMLKNNRQEVYIITMLTIYFKTLWLLIEAIRNSSNKFDIAREVGVNPYFIDDYKIALNYFSPSNIENNFIYLCQADEKLKTSSGSNLFIMQELLLNIIKDK